jgi:hypothetical protein
MEFIKRYFETVEEAEAFIQQINTLLGIPLNAEAVTRTYTEYQSDEDGIYVLYEEYVDILLSESLK